MSFKRELELTKNIRPTERTYKFAEEVGNYFNNMRITTAGVIAVGIGSDDKCYLGLSPYLQMNVTSEGGYLKFGSDLKSILGAELVYYKEALEDIVAKARPFHRDIAVRGCSQDT